MGDDCTTCDFRMGEFCFNPKKTKPGQLAISIAECDGHTCESTEYSE